MSGGALRPPSALTNGLGGYVARLWEMRHYALRLGASSVRAANGGTSLGALWLVLEPVISVAIYWAIFGVLLDISRGVENFLAFLTVGQITFGLCQRALLGASASLNTQAPMLRSLAFPRAILPISEVVRSLFTFRFEALIMLIAVLLMGESIRLSWLLVPFVALLATATCLGLGLFFARLVVRVTDVQRLLSHAMRLAFYGSGVFFPLSGFTDSVGLVRLATINPFYDYVELMRWVILGTRPSAAGLVVAMAIIWPVVAMLVGGTFFASAEHTYSGARTVRA